MNDKDWKQLYEELLRRHEDETAASQELELLLCRTISRLTLAADGLDERLDSHLKSIRRAVKSGDGATLKERLTALSDGLLHPAEAPENGDAEPDYSQLLSPLALSTKDAAEAEQLLRLLSDNPVAMEYELGQRIGVQGTPAIVTENGKIIPGYVPAERLALILDAHTAKK